MLLGVYLRSSSKHDSDGWILLRIARLPALSSLLVRDICRVGCHLSKTLLEHGEANP